MIANEVIVAQLRVGSDPSIISDERGESIPQDVIGVLKYICKQFANYILVDNQFIQLIHNELRKLRIEYNMHDLEKQIDSIAPYFKEDSELTTFSVLDGEDLHEYE